MEQKKLDIEIDNVNEKINKVTKWSRFKHDRIVAIDKYVREVRKKFWIQQIVANIKVILGLKEYSRIYKEKKRMWKIHLNRIFVCIKISKLLKNK